MDLCLHSRSISWSQLGWYIIHVIPSIFSQFLHSMLGTGCGLGLVVLLYISISHCHTLITFQMWHAYRKMCLQIIYVDIFFNWFLISFVHFQGNFEHRSSLLWWQDLVMTSAAGQWFAMMTLHLWVLHWRSLEICQRSWNVGRRNITLLTFCFWLWRIASSWLVIITCEIPLKAMRNPLDIFTLERWVTMKRSHWKLL